MNLPDSFKSAKFWMAVVSAFLVVANEGLGLNIPSDVVLAFAALIISYILGDSAVSTAKEISEGRIRLEEARIAGQIKYAQAMKESCTGTEVPSDY